VEYSGEFEALATEELAQLPEGLVGFEMMGDYSVMRDQSLACSV
jgi:hypothetical protein